MDDLYWADKTSLIGKKAVIGKNTRIWQFCNIMDGAIVGEDCNIGQNVYIENGVKIGNGVKIKNNVAVYQGVICGNDVFLGPNCVFTNVLNPRSFIEKKNEIRNTVIEEGVTIGANATIVCGHTIGKYAMIGAGAVITHDIMPYQLMIGNPGRPAGYVCKCGETLKEKEGYFRCIHCSRTYCLNTEGLLEEEN